MDSYSMPSKRKSESILEEPFSKPSKQSKDELLKAVTLARQSLRVVVNRVPLPNLQHIASMLIATLDSIETREEFNEVILEQLKPVDCPDFWVNLDMIHPRLTSQYKFFVEKADLDLALVAEQYRSLCNFCPPPSDYGKHSIWDEWQKRKDAILCLRPSDKQGLSLSILDDVFRKFRLQVKKPLPMDPNAIAALHASFDLCQTMGDSFINKEDRQKAFDDCIQNLFPLTNWWHQYEINPINEISSANVDACFHMNRVIYIIREDKVESGEGGSDVYVQISRDYQMYISTLHDNNNSLLLHGAPTFLLCVLGPILFIAGGFYDGRSTIVEPLVEPSIMLPDHLEERQQVLACQLFALKQAIDSLTNRQQSQGNIPKPLIAGVPQVYPSFTPLLNQQTSENLTFSGQFDKGHPNFPSLFLATLANSTTCLVKLVNGKYGVVVHQQLAECGLAPFLYGYRCLEGAPTAYIMEYLHPRSAYPPCGGWVTLYDFCKISDTVATHKEHIWITLNQILEVLEGEGMVHGDLRPSNIMIEVDEKDDPIQPLGVGTTGLCLKVIDFDWGGKAGQVDYPLTRNPSIRWPGRPGEPIVAGSDRKLVEGWWSIFPRLE